MHLGVLFFKASRDMEAVVRQATAGKYNCSLIPGLYLRNGAEGAYG
jgi:hypothetical protein